MDRWSAFLTRVYELKDLDGILALLSWDDETYAPPAGRGPRGQQTGTLEAIRHQRLVDPALGELLDTFSEAKLKAEDSVLVARVARLRALAVRVPERLVKALAEARATALQRWQAARAADDFAQFQGPFEALLALLRERADCLSSNGGRYDALLDEYEPGMTDAALAPTLTALRAALVPLVQAIAERPRPDTSFLEADFDEDAQWRFTLQLLDALGFDRNRGRQDRSAHPFSTGISEDDVRLTTRIYKNNLGSAVFSTIHEAGHGLYEQGFDPAHARTYLAAAPSMGIHESQSRLWENLVGRSEPFWHHFLPILQTYFPGQLQVSAQAMTRAVNRVTPSLIRTEADEVTYNLHILLRWELERALLSGDLTVAELPGAWREKMKAYLGLEPKGDADGCLQDIHWASGAIGYFPTYTLGNLYAAQLMGACEQTQPACWQQVGQGELAPLLAWLRQNIHRRGHTASASEIIADAVGRPLEVETFMGYLKRKYSALYDL